MADINLPDDVIADIRRVAYWKGYKEGFEAGRKGVEHAESEETESAIEKLRSQIEEKKIEASSSGYRQGRKDARKDFEYLIRKEIESAIERVFDSKDYV